MNTFEARVLDHIMHKWCIPYPRANEMIVAQNQKVLRAYRERTPAEECAVRIFLTGIKPN